MKYSRLIILLIAIVVISTSSCKKIDNKLIESGVSLELAKLREKQLDNIKYHISINIPNNIENKLSGHEIIEFNYTNINNSPVIIDFRNPSSFVKSVKKDGKAINYSFENEHIIISPKEFAEGKNQIEIEFIAGDRALNRNDEYLYTLFVPDRACTAFPCFDQPSLKAKFKPEITVPKDWTSVANANLIETKSESENTIYVFDETQPISTYLFSFVAGKFKSISKTFDDMTITMYHREQDLEKLERNTDKLFELKYSSLKWLEDYTKIKYPFQKFDFIVIPSFQYSGMEHPGAVLYRDSKMFLDETATIRDELNRANLIAHETAHMWFGDLVTMEWFSEVWLKEVFANFMAGKIVNPQYPEINHDLNFLINHYPASYSVDRTKGANPIEQELDNMKNAGTLYGAIIYHKTPIVMNHLEKLLGEDKLKDGIQEYLSSNMYGNATWDELIEILNSRTEYKLDTWSKSWVYEPGMPHYYTQRAFDENNKLSSLIIEQNDPSLKGRQWTQDIKVLVQFSEKNKEYSIELTDTFNVLGFENENSDVNYILTNSNGLGYGFFRIDPLSKENILKNLPLIKDPVQKCSMYINLWENMLNQNILPYNLIKAYLNSLETENNPQNANLVLNYINSLYWNFLTADEKELISAELEDFLWDRLNICKNISMKSSIFKTYYLTLTSKKGLDNLYNIWNKNISIKDLKLSENDFSNIALELAIKDYIKKDEVLKLQSESIQDKEKKTRFEFLSSSITKRDEFFESLMDEKNREKEPWVADALHYLNHPLKNKESIKYIRPSLEILQELQITGDIFFPKQWLDGTFSGHSTIDAVTEINLFLNENPDYPENLKNKILQSTDLVYRASIIKKE